MPRAEGRAGKDVGVMAAVVPRVIRALGAVTSKLDWWLEKTTGITTGWAETQTVASYFFLTLR